MTGLRCAVVGEDAALSALAPAWEALWHRVPDATPFQHPAWLCPWWRVFGTGRPIVGTLWDGERLAGALPLYVLEDAGSCKLLPMGVGLSDYFDALIEPGLPADSSVLLLRAALRAGFAAGAEICDLVELPPWAVLLRAMPALRECAAHAEGASCPVLPLGDAGTAEAAVPARQARKLRMNRHRAARRGGWDVQGATTATLGPILDRLLRLNARRWGDQEAGGAKLPLRHGSRAARCRPASSGAAPHRRRSCRLLLRAGRCDAPDVLHDRVRSRLRRGESGHAADRGDDRRGDRRRPPGGALPARQRGLQIRLGCEGPSQRELPRDAGGLSGPIAAIGTRPRRESDRQRDPIAAIGTRPRRSRTAGIGGMSDPVALCLAGRISPPVMLARLVLGGGTSAAVRAALLAASGTEELLAFFAPRAAAIDRLHAMLQGVDHARGSDVAGIAAQFDAAVAAAPEASVAAYSLGDPVLLERATAELVTWLAREHLFAAGMDVIDLGCGFGRVAAALAPDAGSVLGLDVSPGMIAEARKRYGGLRDIRFARVDGCGLAWQPPSSCDLLLAVDCFPYLFQAGVAETHIAESARVLRAGGALVILNLSYATQPAADRDRAVSWAARDGLGLEQDGTSPFALWDGAAFVFRAGRTAPAGGRSRAGPEPGDMAEHA